MTRDRALVDTTALICLCLAAAALAGDLPKLTGPYLGQSPPGSEAVIFAPGLVSVEGRYEYAASIHPKGDRFLFSAESPDGGAAVHESRMVDGRWTAPAKVSLTAGAKKSEMEAFFSADGRHVFFAPYDEGMDVRVWVVDVTADGFSKPRPLGEPVAQDPAFYPVQAADGGLYYTNLAKRTTYRAVLDKGKAKSAEPVGLELGGHAYPSPDGSFIVLDSASLDSEGQRDIFVAYRGDDGSWSTPKPLGPEVNTEHSETCPSLSPDGEYLFFSRYNEPGDVSDIYWVSSEVIRKGPTAD